MKRKLFLIGMTLLVMCSNLWARQPYECTKAGTNLYYAIYNKKGNLTDCFKTVVLGVEDRDSCRVISQFEYKLDKHWNPVTDKKGVPLKPDTIEVLMLDRGITGNLSAFVGGRGEPIDSATQAFLKSKGYEYFFESSGTTDFIYPDRMVVGDTLCRFHAKDGSIKIDTGESALSQSTLDVVIYVTAQEKLHTPAGDFDCCKIIVNVDWRIKSPMYNPVEQHQFVEWVAPGVGTVRAGELDKKGRLMDYMELTRIDWPDAAQ